MKTMKKVLAVVLALTMVFAFGSLAVSAKEITSGQIYCGPEGTVYANPGETVKAPIQFVADAFESEHFTFRLWYSQVMQSLLLLPA